MDDSTNDNTGTDHNETTESQFLTSTDRAALYIVGKLALHGHLTYKDLEADEFPYFWGEISTALEEAMPYLDDHDIQNAIAGIGQ